jgi:hypothetical protein
VLLARLSVRTAITTPSSDGRDLHAHLNRTAVQVKVI